MLYGKFFKEGKNDSISRGEKDEGQGNKEHLEGQNGVLIDKGRSGYFLNREELKVKAIKDC